MNDRATRLLLLASVFVIATCGLIYGFGLIAIWWAPDTTGRQLDD